MRSEQPSKAPGQHQSRSLMDTEPVSLHEFDPANNRTVGRVDCGRLQRLFSYEFLPNRS